MQPGSGVNRDGLLTEDPVGTIAEVQRIGLPSQLVKTCSMPDGDRNLGCKHFLRCQMANAGKAPYKGESGPHNHGVYRISGTSGRAFVKIFPCYRFLDHVEEWRQNGDRVAICGDEGDVVPASGTMEKQIGIDRKTGRAIWGPRPLRPGVIVPRHMRPAARFPHAVMDAEIQGMIARRLASDDMAAIAAGQAFIPGMPAPMGGMPNRVAAERIPMEGQPPADPTPQDLKPVQLIEESVEAPDPDAPLSLELEEEAAGDPLDLDQP